MGYGRAEEHRRSPRLLGPLRDTLSLITGQCSAGSHTARISFLAREAADGQSSLPSSSSWWHRGAAGVDGAAGWVKQELGLGAGVAGLCHAVFLAPEGVDGGEGFVAGVE